ncbi:hypothetical protein N865_13700 [Intrasporangium oryzae NRRL B-24470]|uniref:Uncharacterized protein n=1 Tax=Intrasporangium oryzae NRRL B-24470 TaxID=1386089 RepID=W9G7K4_9MICO|nr:hypothetical protein [Intrasporangium oryzae]EWT00803.1 hypothetical protein N865_13700 [Intrasporangium oryzae NRRL B-24470]
MDTTPNPTTPRTTTVPSALRRGVRAAGAVVAVAFVGVAGVGAGQARAAGIENGLAYSAGSGEPAGVSSTDPTNLPAASTLAVRYVSRDGRLTEL